MSVFFDFSKINKMSIFHFLLNCLFSELGFRVRRKQWNILQIFEPFGYC